jgi:hypothetical protein
MTKNPDEEFAAQASAPNVPERARHGGLAAEAPEASQGKKRGALR